MITGCGTYTNAPRQRVTRVQTSANAAQTRDNARLPYEPVPLETIHRANEMQTRRSQPISQPTETIATTSAFVQESVVSRNQPQALATHETEFNAKEKNRKNNIARAAAAIDGHIVQPGEVFSYNETVGPTNERRGYKKGIIFVKGEKKEGVGGGVCQVSTTLYNAVDNAGLEILERHDHSRPVTYAEEGDEAATSYGGIDFKFKNDKSFPVMIHSSVNKGTISVTISAV